MDKKNPRIAVIGAGLAGLTTAHRLIEKGFFVDLYEATDRIGGRVWTYRQEKSYEELGAKFINDGGEALHLKDLLDEFGVDVETFGAQKPKSYFFNGKLGSFLELFENMPFPDEKNYQRLKERVVNVTSLAEILSFFLADYPDLLRFNLLRISGYLGSPADKLSPHYFDLFWHFYLQDFQAAEKRRQGRDIEYKIELANGGLDKLTSALAKKLGKAIFLNHPLTSISEYLLDQLELEFKRHERKKYEAAVLTIPCTTLKEVEFEEGLLPEDQLLAIRTLQYGTSGKILFKIETLDKDLPFSAYGPDFILWFNRDHTILTAYFCAEAGVFDPSDVENYADKVWKCKEAIQKLYPSVNIVGEPIPLSWAKQPFIGGSNSNFGVKEYEFFHKKAEAFGVQIREVFRPVKKKLFFAGEHTALDYPGTLEGAVASGNRAAKMVAKLFGY